MGKRKHRRQETIDDPTFAEMSLEADAPRARKEKPASLRPDPWQLVAAECPCKASADSHRLTLSGLVRVHIETPILDGEARMKHLSPVHCVPGTCVSVGEYAPQPMPDGWRKTSAYRRAELSGRQ